MKKILTLSNFFVAIFLIYSCNLPKNSITTEDTPFVCGQMIDFDRRLETDPVFRAGLERLEAQTNDYLNRLRETNFSDFRSTVVTIPVVVHVVYENATENISNAKVQSQIDALNNFFRRLNTDVSSVPAPFNSLCADVMIEFVLAKRDPNCLPTTGITRTATTVTTFTYNPSSATAQSRNPVKFNASGGQNGWPPDQYLNLWVCDLGSSLIGYASFPSDLATRPTEDGVVMNYQGFGTIPPLFGGLNLGRVCGHEVGHWLNLRHIWGDESLCAGTDYVADTPNQGPNNTGCPTFPKIDACSPISPGVMFQNHMDYTNDACRRMFTLGQSDRMAATLFTVRNSLLSSQGAVPPPIVSMSDLWIKDTDSDLGNEPNNESTDFWVSDDIWVRNNNDGLMNQESQNALSGSTNYVYIRVRNKGCQASASGETLKLYWAKASSGLSWPAPWDGSVVLSGTTKMGDEILPSQPIGILAGNSATIFVFQWNNVPDPSDYSSLGVDLNHFCLLARIEEPSGMTIPEVVGDLYGNVKKNNNVAWKNIAIDDTDGSAFTSTLISNYTKENKYYKITIDKKTNEMGAIKFDTVPGVLYVNFDKGLQKLIENNKVAVSGLNKINDSLYVLYNSRAEIKGLNLKPSQHHVIRLKFVLNKEFSYQRYVYEFDLEQSDEKTGEVIGGQLFKFKYNKTR